MWQGHIYFFSFYHEKSFELCLYTTRANIVSHKWILYMVFISKCRLYWGYRQILLQIYIEPMSTIIRWSGLRYRVQACLWYISDKWYSNLSFNWSYVRAKIAQRTEFWLYTISIQITVIPAAEISVTWKKMNL